MASRVCPVCDKSFPAWADLKEHLKGEIREGDKNHMDVVELEGWDLYSDGPPEEPT